MATNKKRVSIYLSEEDKKAVEALAEADHRTVSGYIEVMVIERIKQASEGNTEPGGAKKVIRRPRNSIRVKVSQ